MELVEFLSRLNLQDATVILQKRKESIRLGNDTVEKVGVRSYVSKVFFDQGSVAISAFVEYDGAFPETPFEVVASDLQRMMRWGKNVKLDGKRLYIDDDANRSGTLPLMSDPSKELKMKTFDDSYFEFAMAEQLRTEEIEHIIEAYEIIKPETINIISDKNTATFNMENVDGRSMSVRTNSIGVFAHNYPKMLINILKFVSGQNSAVSYSPSKHVLKFAVSDVNSYMNYYLHPISLGLSKETEQKESDIQ
jgi:hypothetical protein